jgi:hypothetical protein
MEMEQMMERLLVRMGEMNTNAIANQEDLLVRMDSKQAEMKADQARMETKLDSNQDRMAKFEGKMEEIIEHQMKHFMMAMWYTTLEAIKIEQDPGMMQYMEEHQHIPTEEVTVMLVGGLMKRLRDLNLATGCRQKPKGRIQVSLVSQKRLGIAGRKVTCHVKVAWCKGDRKYCTRANVVEDMQKGWNFGRRQLKQKCSKSIRR